MNTVLVNPPVDYKMTLGKMKEFSKVSIIHPIGLACLSAFLRRNNFEVSVIDAYAHGLSVDETAKGILEKKPNVVGFSCVTQVMPFVYEIAKRLKLYDKNIIIICGGIHPTLMADDTLSHEAVDIVVRGEGELTLLELLSEIQKKDVNLRYCNLEDILGISSKRNERLIHTPNRSNIEDLDSLPLPSWEFFPLEAYSYPPHWTINPPVYPVMATRGCPFRCTFCSLKVMGKKQRYRSTDSILREIRYLISKFGARQLMFMDATFPMKREWVIDLCNKMIDAELNKEIVWGCEMKVDRLDLAILTKMKSAGCQRVFFGIESGVQQLLNNVKKDFTLEDVRRGIALCKKAKLETIGFFMLGLPGETKELSLRTIAFAKELDLDFAKFNLTVPYPGTELYKELIKQGKFKTKDWDKFTSFGSMTEFDPVYIPEGMTREEIEWVHKKAYQSFYFRPKMIWRYLLKINSLDSIKRYWTTSKAIIRGLQ